MPTSEMVQPTQGDRDAVQRMLDHAFRNVGVKALRDVALADLLEHFARHRLAGMAVGREEAAAAAQAEADKLEATAGALSGWTVTRARIDQCQKVKAAILRTKEEDHGIRA